MTRKDHVVIATALGQAVKEMTPSTSMIKAVDMIVEHVTHALQVDNPAFIPETFKQFVRKISYS